MKWGDDNLYRYSFLSLTFSSCIIHFPISFFLPALFPSQIISLSIPAFPNTTPQSIHLINNPFSYSSHPILKNHLSFTLLLKQLLKAPSPKVSFYPENFLCSTHPKMYFPSFAVRSSLSRGEVEDS